MKQRTFASQAEFKKYGRKSRRELFLDEMERVVPSGLNKISSFPTRRPLTRPAFSFDLHPF